MDNTLREGYIEIELTANEPARRHRDTARRSERSSVVTVPGAPPTPPPRVVTERAEPASRPPANRLIGIAAGAGLLVGWLAGSAGGNGGPRERAATATTVAAVDVGPPPTFADDPALVEPAAPVLTTAADGPRVATTTNPVGTAHLLGLDPRLLGLPYEIVATLADGDIEYVNLARGMVTILDGPYGADTGRLFAGDTWVLVPFGSTGDAMLYDERDPTPRRIENVDPWTFLGIPGSATLWMPDDNLRMNRPGQMIEVTPDLEPTDVRIDVPAPPTMIEPAGNFVVPAAGGVYVVSGAGISRLTTGRVIALGPSVALAEECDEQLACTYVVIDRATAERRELPGLVRGAPLQPLDWWAQSSQTVSPDGQLAMVVLPDHERDPYGSGYMATPRLAVIDLVTGQTTPLTEQAGYVQSVVRWTADSQFAFFMTDRGLFAYVASSGELLRAGPDASTNPPRAFELRPSVGTPLLHGTPAP